MIKILKKGKFMKSLILSIIIFISILYSNISYSYTIGGAYAQQISCDWGQYGYEYGYVGTYKLANGQIHQIYFGNNYCPY